MSDVPIGIITKKIVKNGSLLGIFSLNVILNLFLKKKSNSNKELNRIQEEYILHKKEIYDDIFLKFKAVINEKHENFLKKYHLKSKGIKKSKIHRTSGCWHCKYPVDNAVDFECENCGWIICDRCGACGCGYK